jgi:hypothetical protein
VSCSIGVLGFGSTATVTMATKVTAAGTAMNTASVSNPDQPDPNGSNSTTTTTTTIAAAPTAVGPPVYGESFNLRPVSGTVLVKLPGTADFVPITDVQNVPEGTEVDANKGSVELTSGSDPSGGLQTAIFYFGRFVITYEPPKIGTVPTPPGSTTNLVTQLLLSEPLTCPSSKQQRRTAAATAKKRSLWGTGKGNFRTRGKFAAATVRGTYWFTQDTCTTTFEKTRVGEVDVYDFVLAKHIFVDAGQSYTAKKKK